jgi:hypothetical protein
VPSSLGPKTYEVASVKSFPMSNHYNTPVPKAIAENEKFMKYRRRLLNSIHH